MIIAVEVPPPLLSRLQCMQCSVCGVQFNHQGRAPTAKQRKKKAESTVKAAAAAEQSAGGSGVAANSAADNVQPAIKPKQSLQSILAGSVAAAGGAGASSLSSANIFSSDSMAMAQSQRMQMEQPERTSHQDSAMKALSEQTIMLKATASASSSSLSGAKRSREEYKEEEEAAEEHGETAKEQAEKEQKKTAVVTAPAAKQKPLDSASTETAVKKARLLDGSTVDKVQPRLQQEQQQPGATAQSSIVKSSTMTLPSAALASPAVEAGTAFKPSLLDKKKGQSSKLAAAAPPAPAPAPAPALAGLSSGLLSLLGGKTGTFSSSLLPAASTSLSGAAASQKGPAAAAAAGGKPLQQQQQQQKQQPAHSFKAGGPGAGAGAGRGAAKGGAAPEQKKAFSFGQKR